MNSKELNDKLKETCCSFAESRRLFEFLKDKTHEQQQNFIEKN